MQVVAGNGKPLVVVYNSRYFLSLALAVPSWLVTIVKLAQISSIGNAADIINVGISSEPCRCNNVGANGVSVV